MGLDHKALVMCLLVGSLEGWMEPRGGRLGHGLRIGDQGPGNCHSGMEVQELKIQEIL